MNNPKIEKRPVWVIIFSVIAILFGLATIKEGGTVLFTEAGRLSAGHFVTFVLWFNFVAGFAYIAAGVTLFRLNSYSKHISIVLATSTTIVFILFAIHIFNGGEYEMRTVIAMTLRSALWISIAISAFRSQALSQLALKDLRIN